MVDEQELAEKVKRQMNQPQIHDTWEAWYRTAGNERSFEMSYDDWLAKVDLPEGSLALDIGCGICANSIRLARRGFRVVGADYSESILEPARQNVERNGLADRITVRREDAMNLSFADGHFDLALCWGVLMHLPAAERALGELVRVTRPGGYVVLEEINMDAPESRLFRSYWRTFHSKKIAVNRTPAGYEHTCHFAGETLFWRHTDPAWLARQFADRGCSPVDRRSGLFSDMYLYMPARLLKAPVHAWNRHWIRKRADRPGSAYHNVYVFRKA